MLSHTQYGDMGMGCISFCGEFARRTSRRMRCYIEIISVQGSRCRFYADQQTEQELIQSIPASFEVCIYLFVHLSFEVCDIAYDLFTYLCTTKL